MVLSLGILALLSDAQNVMRMRTMALVLDSSLKLRPFPVVVYMIHHDYIRVYPTIWSKLVADHRELLDGRL